MAEDNKDWMDKLKEGSSSRENKPDPGPEALMAGSGKNPAGYFSGVFKFQIGEKVRSRIHECEGVVEYSEMTRYINRDQISYKIRFNDPEVFKTETSMIDEDWLEKI